MKRLASILTLASLAACGGGGSSTPAAAAAQPVATCTPKVVRVQLFGDSTMNGYDSFTKALATPSPTQDMQAAMDARFGLGAVVVTLNAIVGSSSAALINGTSGYQPFPLGVDADIVVFNYGINDQDPVVGEPIDQYEANLRQIVKLSPATVVFETPNDAPAPWLGPDAGNPGYAAYAQRMRDVAVSLSVPVADTFAYVHTVPNWQTYFNDGAHPGAPMYALIVANSLAPTVTPLVSKLRCGA